MRVRKHFIFAAAVVAVTIFGPSNASAWGYSQHGYGSYFGLGRHFGFGRHYGFGRHHRYGRRHYRGRSYALPPAHSWSPRPEPTPSTADPASNCRDFTTTVVIDGDEQTVSGTACRRPDGQWKVVE